MIPTAEEFLRGKPFSVQAIHQHMVEFAKLHVEAALKAASDMPLKSEPPCVLAYCECPDYSVDCDSILNAYPLTNIK